MSECLNLIEDDEYGMDEDLAWAIEEFNAVNLEDQEYELVRQLIENDKTILYRQDDDLIRERCKFVDELYFSGVEKNSFTAKISKLEERIGNLQESNLKVDLLKE